MDNTRIGRSIGRLHAIMQTLRGPGGCPWDALQTTRSLKPYLLEETYELLEALDDNDPSQIRDELGDLLLQIVFHSQIFAEQALFDLADVADAICDKLDRRHPHVFSDLTETEIPALNRQWDRIKASEKGSRARSAAPLDGIPATLPALARAAKYLERSSRGEVPATEDSKTGAALRASHDRLTRLAGNVKDHASLETAFGDFLLTAVAWGRSLDLDAEQALRQAIDRVAKRNDRPPPGAGD
jgi:nucleoside triphosphate diphosphatase